VTLLQQYTSRVEGLKIPRPSLVMRVRPSPPAPQALYRGHRCDCKAAIRTSKFDERKKGYRRCDYPIFASGTLAGRFRRQSTGTWEWDTAKALLAALEKAGSWDAQKPKPSQPPIAAASDPRRITILEATEAYMTTCKHRGLQPSYSIN
jgi:hypothetical protein